MRIKGTDSSPVDGGGTRAVDRVRRSTAVASGTHPAQSGADSVHITDSAHQLASLQQAVNAVPEIDAQRVDALQQAIEGGTYRADPARIADKLLQLEGELSGNGRKA